MDEQRRHAEYALDEADSTCREARRERLGLQRVAPEVPSVGGQRQMRRLESVEWAAEEAKSAWPAGRRSCRAEGFRGLLLKEAVARTSVWSKVHRLGRKTRVLNWAINKVREAAEAADRRRYHR